MIGLTSTSTPKLGPACCSIFLTEPANTIYATTGSGEVTVFDLLLCFSIVMICAVQNTEPECLFCFLSPGPICDG